MPIQKLYRVQCGTCFKFVPKPTIKGLGSIADESATPLFTSYQDGMAYALERGWSAYPIACPDHKESR